MFDNKLKNFHKCSKSQNNVEVGCLRKCFKWNLGIRTEEYSNNYHGDYRSNSDSLQRSSNLNQAFPIDTSRLSICKSQNLKFAIEYLLNGNSLLCSRTVALLLNV
jgi:hypothetical protein